MNLINRIIRAVESEFSLEEGTLRGYSRLKHTSRARMIAMYLSRLLTDSSLHEIAKEFNKDHTSVVWACKRIRLLMVADITIKDTVQRITNLVVFELWDDMPCVIYK